MNQQEYIESGILEEYVMGLLSEQDSRKLNDIAARYPIVRAALNETQQVWLKYLSTHSKAPRSNFFKKLGRFKK